MTADQRQDGREDGNTSNVKCDGFTVGNTRHEIQDLISVGLAVWSPGWEPSDQVVIVLRRAQSQPSLTTQPQNTVQSCFLISPSPPVSPPLPTLPCHFIARPAQTGVAQHIAGQASAPFPPNPRPHRRLSFAIAHAHLRSYDLLLPTNKPYPTRILHQRKEGKVECWTNRQHMRDEDRVRISCDTQICHICLP